MKAKFLTAMALAASVYAMPAGAQVVDDPLHSVVCGAGGTNCVNTDNGTFSPLSSSANWGFEISPPNSHSGTLVLGILVPTNEINTATFLLPTLTDNGGGPLSESVISRTTFLTAATSNITSYLNLSGSFSPATNFSNLSAGVALQDPGFGGAFLAFTVTLNGITLNGQGNPLVGNDFSFGSNLPAGTVITGFFSYLDNGVLNNVATAASEDLVVTPTSAVPEPATWAMMLIGFMGLAFAFRQRRRMVGFAA